MTRYEITAKLSAMIEKKINPNNDPRIYWAKDSDVCEKHISGYNWAELIMKRFMRVN